MTDMFAGAPEWATVRIAEDKSKSASSWGGREAFARSFEVGADYVEVEDTWSTGQLNMYFYHGKVIARRGETALWDGERALQAGLTVKYIGTGNVDTGLYGLPPQYGQEMVLVGEDSGYNGNTLWICKWRDPVTNNLRLMPFLPEFLGQATERPSEEAVNFVAEYEAVQGDKLDVKVVDSILKKSKTVVTRETLEITLLNDGSFSGLRGVDFPVTIRVTKNDVFASTPYGLYIKTQLLSLLPGASYGEVIDSDHMLYFSIGEEVEVDYDKLMEILE
ncbi:hypothetical protein [Citrobacter phage Tr1]|nr:hypothetical protein [Citrobacter phage Tr1]